jgi:radical SAM-linked protein
MSPGREPAESQLSVARYRLRIAKSGDARYLSHLDTVRAMLRTLRRATVPVALSGGFNPQPKVAYATALAVGVESEAEYIDIELVKQVEPMAIARAVAAELPNGFNLRELRTVPLRRPAIASYNAVSRYEAAPAPTGEASLQAESVTELAARLSERVAGLLAAPELVVERQHGKHMNVRPNIVSIGVTAGPRVDFELLSEQSGAPRVTEVMSLLGLDPADWQVRKTDFWPLEKGTRVSPWQA